MELRPVNNECPIRFPFKYLTPEGQECCRKLAGFTKARSKTAEATYNLPAYKLLAKKIYNGVITRKYNYKKHGGYYPNENQWAKKEIPCEDVLVSVMTDQERKEVPIYELLIDSINMFPETMPVVQKITDDLFDNEFDEENSDDQQGGASHEKELRDLCELVASVLPTKKWLKKQKSYVDGLSDKDKMFMRFYTKKGDVFLNTYIRNGYKLDESSWSAIQKLYEDPSNYETRQIFLDENATDLKEANNFAKNFYDSIQKTIMNAPPLDKDIVVWRGLKSAAHFDNLKDHIYINKGIMSTGMKPGIAHNFAFIRLDIAKEIYNTSMHSFSESERYGNITKITIPKGYSVLYMSITEFIGEMEILLPDNSIYYVTKSFRKIPYIIDSKFVSPSFMQTIVSTEIPTNEIILIKE